MSISLETRNLKYWRDGFDALFERYEELDNLARRIVSRRENGDDYSSLLDELALLVW